MKKIFFIFLMILALCFSACADDASDATDTDAGSEIVGGTEEDTVAGEEDTAFDLWAGIEGDTRELTVEFAGSSMTAVLNKDGTGRLDQIVQDYSSTSDLGDAFRDLDAELAGIITMYGNYAVEENKVVVTVDLQQYSRIVVRGEDAEAFKDLYIENYGEEFKDAFDKGFVGYEETGTATLVLSIDGDACRVHTGTMYNEDGVREEEIVISEDGSYTDTEYYESGATEVVSEYNSDGDMSKKTSYYEDGSVCFVETTERDETGYVRTTTDADGNVMAVHEQKDEMLKDNYYLRTIKTTENGVVTKLEIYEWYINEYGVMVTPNRYSETVTGNETSVIIELGNIGVTYTGWDNEYYLYKSCVDGVVTDYTCKREIKDEENGVLVRYHIRNNVYEDRTIYVMEELHYTYDGEVYWEDEELHKWIDIPAAEYVPADWETPVFPEYWPEF